MPLSNAEKVRASAARRRHRARETGLCITCCRERPIPGRVVCSTCTAKNLERKRARRLLVAGRGATARSSDHAGPTIAPLDVELSTSSLRATIGVAERLFLSGKGAEAVTLLGSTESAAVEVSDWNLAAEVLGTFCKLESRMGAHRSCLKHAHAILKLPLPRNSVWLMTGHLYYARALVYLGKVQIALNVLMAATKRCDYTRVGALASYLEVRALAELHGSMKALCLKDFQLASDLAQAIDDPWTHAVLLNNFAVAAARFGEVALAKELHARAISFASEHRLGALIEHAKLSQIQSMLVFGEIQQIKGVLQGLVPFSKALLKKEGHHAAVVACLAATLMGEKLADFSRPHLCCAVQTGSSAAIAATAGIYHVFYSRSGMMPEAQAMLSDALPRLDASLFGSWCSLWLAIEVALYGTASDCERVLSLARPGDDIVVQALLLLIQARLAHLTNDQSVTALHAGRAEAIFRAIGFRYFEAVAMEVGGRLREAHALYESIGAIPDARRLRGLQDAPLVRPRLTPRQEQVVSLVMQGLGVDRIATCLRISAKTAEHHLESAMQSVGVNRREDLKESPYTAHLLSALA